MALMDQAESRLTGGVGWSEQDARARGVEIRRIEEARNQELEDHKASVLTAVTGAWRFDTGTGVATTQALDMTQEYDPTFNLDQAMIDDRPEFSVDSKDEQEVLSKARNQVHYETLKERLRDKREFQLNAIDMGVLPSMGLQLVAELGNIPNYFTFGLSNLKKVSKLKQFLIAGAVTGGANVAEEAYINSQYHDRTATDYAVAGALGIGMGWLSLGGKDPKLAKHMDDVGDGFADTHIRNSVDETLGDDKPKNAPTGTPEGATLREQVYGDGSVGAAQVKDIYETLDPDNQNRPKTPWMNEDSDIAQATYQAVLNGDIPKAEKMMHEHFGLASIGQSLHSSDNPITRYMADALLEFPEGSGFKRSTAALQADLDFQFFSTGYMKGYIDFKREFIKVAEAKGVSGSFDEIASLWVSGSDKIKGMDIDIAKIMDDFEKHYVQWNDWTYNKMKESGVDEAKDIEYDPNHLYRGWDGKKVHKLRTQYGDQVMVDTFAGAIHEGKVFRKAQEAADMMFEKEAKEAHKTYIDSLKPLQDDIKAMQDRLAKMDNSLSAEGMSLANKIEKAARKFEAKMADAPDPVYKGPDLDAEVKRIAEAMYHRFLRRATVSTADANLLSTANRGLLNDILNDLNLKDADRRHIDAVLESMGKDRKENPLKHKVSMDIGYQHPSGLKIMDMMHTDLGSAYASKQRYWLGRSAAAKRGFGSEDAFNAAIEELKKHGSDRGSDPQDIKADVARLQAGWKLIHGIPVENMDAFGSTAMRVVRKLAQTSMLGKLGITQLGETGRIMAAAGVTNLIDAIPLIRDAIMDLKDGRLDTAMLKDFEEAFLGRIGDEHYMQHPDFRVDDFGHAITEAEKKLDSAAYWLSAASGWRVVYTQQKRLLMNHLGHRFYDWFANETITKAQLDDLGVPYHQVERIRDAMLEFAEFDSDGILQSLHLDSWEPDIRETIGLMLHRKSHNAIQGILAGETPLWLNTGLGKFLGQFKSFSIASLGKQTIHDWKMYKEGDKEAALAFQFMLASGTMALIARTGFYAATLPSDQRGEYLEGALNPKAIAFKLLQYHGQTGPMVDVVDMLASTVTPDSWGRVTGTEYRQRNVWNRVPGLNYIDKAARGVKGVGKILNPYEDMSKSDWNAIVGTMPLSSWYGFHALNKGIIEPTIFYKDTK